MLVSLLGLCAPCHPEIRRLCPLSAPSCLAFGLTLAHDNQGIERQDKKHRKLLNQPKQSIKDTPSLRSVVDLGVWFARQSRKSTQKSLKIQDFQGISWPNPLRQTSALTKCPHAKKMTTRLRAHGGKSGKNHHFWDSPTPDTGPTPNPRRGEMGVDSGPCLGSGESQPKLVSPIPQGCQTRLR